MLMEEKKPLSSHFVTKRCWNDFGMNFQWFRERERGEREREREREH